MLTGALALAGCGQRGPLYLPDQQPPKKSFAPAAPGQIDVALSSGRSRPPSPLRS